MKKTLIIGAAFVAACATAPPGPAPGLSVDVPAPQIAATAHPLATDAALAMLERGGSPIDAAIAAQMVGGLVEPQSSGIGGGTLVLYWDAGNRNLTSFEGLAAAPEQVTAGLRTDVDGSALPVDVLRGGRSVGVPGTLPTLHLAHRRYGKLPWAALFEPAIALAERGFAMPRYLHEALGDPEAARDHPDLLSLYFGADGRVLPIGSLIRNPEYARTLRRVATLGPDGLFAEGGAQRILDAARRGFRPTLMTENDLRGYRAVERSPLCGPFLVYTVCTMGPPSFGGILVLQLLQMVEARAGGGFDFGDPGFVHVYVEAGKLAQADRRAYAGDPDAVSVPATALVSAEYVRRRAALIDASRAGPEPAAGKPVAALELAPGEGEPLTTTSQISIADKAGNALSMTTTTNLNFGSRLMIDGFMLNNALSNFSAAPKPGERIANAMAPRKKPVTSMAPTIAFDASGRPVVVGGSAGGGPIVDYIGRSLIEMLANGRTPGQAIARGHVTTAVRGKVQLERGSEAGALAPALQARGHVVELTTLRSGLAFIRRLPGGWIGAADPRRDGAAGVRRASGS